MCGAGRDQYNDRSTLMFARMLDEEMIMRGQHGIDSFGVNYWPLKDAKGLKFATMFGKKFLITRSRKRPEIMFVLVRSVRMPPRPFLRPAARSRDNKAAMIKAFGAGFRSIIRKAFRPAPGSPT